MRKELELPLRDIQNATKVLKSVEHLLKIPGHETGERSVTYRVTIPIVGGRQPDLPLPELVDTQACLESHGDQDGDVPGTSNGAIPGDAPGEPDGDGPSTTERLKEKETSYKDGIAAARSRLSPAGDPQSNHDRRLHATKQAINAAARTNFIDGTFSQRRELLDDRYFNDLLGSLKQHPTDDVQGLKQLALEQLVNFLINDSTPPVHFDQHDINQMLSPEDD